MWRRGGAAGACTFAAAAAVREWVGMAAARAPTRVAGPSGSRLVVGGEAGAEARPLLYLDARRTGGATAEGLERAVAVSSGVLLLLFAGIVPANLGTVRRFVARVWSCIVLAAVARVWSCIVLAAVACWMPIELCLPSCKNRWMSLSEWAASPGLVSDVDWVATDIIAASMNAFAVWVIVRSSSLQASARAPPRVLATVWVVLAGWVFVAAYTVSTAAVCTPRAACRAALRSCIRCWGCSSPPPASPPA